jgi:hypothetical protein
MALLIQAVILQDFQTDTRPILKRDGTFWRVLARFGVFVMPLWRAA